MFRTLKKQIQKMMIAERVMAMAKTGSLEPEGSATRFGTWGETICFGSRLEVGDATSCATSPASSHYVRVSLVVQVETITVFSGDDG